MSETNGMARVNARVPKSLIDRVDDLVDAGVYPNRSEAFRDGLREIADKHQFHLK